MTYKQKKQYKFDFILDTLFNMAMVLGGIGIAFISLTSYANQITK
jgi:hypothetical protein